MKAKILIPLLLMLPVLWLPASLGAGGGDTYIVLRANASPLYIENASVPIQVEALYVENNKPAYARVTVHLTVRGLNINYTHALETVINAGPPIMLYLPPMRVGHYDYILYVSVGDIKSRVVEQDFAVVPPPVPYSLTISPDGSKITFVSKKLNETGKPDPDFPFRIEIYSVDINTGPVLVTAYDNITSLNITIPRQWKHGILRVDVTDVYGWRNGNTIDLSRLRYVGEPLQYDYDYEHREPFRSRRLHHLFLAVVVFLLVYGGMWYIGREKK